MNTPALPPEPHASNLVASTLQVTGGIVFIVIWLTVAAAWAVLSLMGGLMANDSGAVSSDKHGMMLAWMLVGEILVALAGIPAGLAFFLSGHRSLLLWSFAGLLVAGLAIQGWALWSFFSAAR